MNSATSNTTGLTPNTGNLPFDFRIQSAPGQTNHGSASFSRKVRIQDASLSQGLKRKLGERLSITPDPIEKRYRVTTPEYQVVDSQSLQPSEPGKLKKRRKFYQCKLCGSVLSYLGQGKSKIASSRPKTHQPIIIGLDVRFNIS